MQLRELPRGGQASIHGNVVNVPADNISTVRMLPKRTCETHTIPVKLKRRMRYKSHFLFEIVRPTKCVAATKYLLRSSALFRDHTPDGFNDKWLTEISEQQEVKAKSEGLKEKDQPQNPDSDDINDDERWSEHGSDDDEVHVQNEETMLSTPDDGKHIFACAPSEHNKPTSIIGNDVEELA